MFAFPLVNLIFLVILYNIHRKIFYGTACIQIVLYIAGVTYVEQSFDRGDNQFLYYLSLTGVGLIIVVAAFFIAISLNHRHLYSDHE